jgi:hypothetical protein
MMCGDTVIMAAEALKFVIGGGTRFRIFLLTWASDRPGRHSTELTMTATTNREIADGQRPASSLKIDGSLRSAFIGQQNNWPYHCSAINSEGCYTHKIVAGNCEIS